MATRSIVTSQPDVACDVCGRRLLRGEHPDVFLAGGQRRTVCELCAPRAADEGWLREADRHAVSLPSGPPRGARAPARSAAPAAASRPMPIPGATRSGAGARLVDEPGPRGAYDFLDGSPGRSPSRQASARRRAARDPCRGRLPQADVEQRAGCTARQRRRG